MKKHHPSIIRGSLLAAALAVTAITHAAPPAEIVIPGEKIFPESLTSTKDGTVIIGSVGARIMWRAKKDAGTAEAWIQPGTHGMDAIFGVLADEKSNTLFVCSNTPGPPGTPPIAPSRLYLLDLRTGALRSHHEMPTAGALCNDIAVDSAGNAYATDTLNMEIARLKKGAKALEVWAGADGAFGPKGGVLDGIAVLGKRVLVNALATSKLFSVPIGKDGEAGGVAEVKLDRPIDRPDGMRSFGRNGLLVAEGGSGGRLSRIALKGDAGTVTVLKEGFPDGAVAVTAVGTTAYVLEGQLAARRAQIAGGSPPPPKPFKATAVNVGKP